MENIREMETDINDLFSKDEIMKKALIGYLRDQENSEYVDAVKKLCLIANKKFAAEEIVDSFELDAVDYLYEKLALRRKKYHDLYFKMISNGNTPYFMNDEINPLFVKSLSDEELENLSPDEIKELGVYSRRGFDYNDIITNYENGTMEDLYNRAKDKIRYEEFYDKVVNGGFPIRK